jgi:Family of unknown function (DUF6328)
MKLEKTIHTAFDELRMQMLGVQVLFGFQFQGVFQERFASATYTAKVVSFVGLVCIVGTLGLLLAAPCQHRLVERGLPSHRIFRAASSFANAALVPFAIALACDFFIVTEPYWGNRAAAFAVFWAALAFALWYGIGLALRKTTVNQCQESEMPDDKTMDLHELIDQMLTEARVVLPGAQALLGFQFAVTMTKTFADLSVGDRAVHFVSLSAMALAIMLLLTPATIHRITFGGRDSPAFHTIGSTLVTAALVPILLGIATDFYVAVTVMFGDRFLAAVGAVTVGVVLAALWYAIPLMLRFRRRFVPDAASHNEGAYQ